MIYKHDLWNLPTKITFFFSLIYLFNVIWFKRVLSYFAKPNFIVYDEWFDNDLKKITPAEKNDKITKISNIHEFFYEQSNYKVGASENNLQLEIKINEKELTKYNYFADTFKKYSSVSNKKFQFFEKLTKNKHKFFITKKLIYSLSIFVFVIIFGFMLFFNSQSNQNNSKTRTKSFLLEKKF